MFQGQYHAHPYGGQSACYSTYYSALTSFTEINCSIQVPNTGPNPQLEGLEEFWVGVSGPHQCLTLRRLIHARRYRSQKGWTCPGPGSHHFPRVRGGGVIALFFLPAGRIACERHGSIDPRYCLTLNTLADNAKPGMPQPRDPGAALGMTDEEA